MSEPGESRGLLAARLLTLGAVVAAFPLATLAVFRYGCDRTAVADAVAWTYSLGLFAACSTAFWPLPSLRTWSRPERVASTAMIFMVISYATHLSWELGWLVLRDAIAEGRDAAWAYPWWAYIDGGDARYASPSTQLVAMEMLSVLNGCVGAAALVTLRRTARPDRRRAAIMACMATAVVHLYSTSLYFGGELLEGLPNVDTTRFVDLWIKFVLANAPWLIFPWFVLAWGRRALDAPR